MRKFTINTHQNWNCGTVYRVQHRLPVKQKYPPGLQFFPLILNTCSVKCKWPTCKHGGRGVAHARAPIRVGQRGRGAGRIARSTRRGLQNEAIPLYYYVTALAQDIRGLSTLYNNNMQIDDMDEVEMKLIFSFI